MDLAAADYCLGELKTHCMHYFSTKTNPHMTMKTITNTNLTAIRQQVLPFAAGWNSTIPSSPLDDESLTFAICLVHFQHGAMPRKAICKCRSVNRWLGGDFVPMAKEQRKSAKRERGDSLLSKKWLHCYWISEGRSGELSGVTRSLTPSPNYMLLEQTKYKHYIFLWYAYIPLSSLFS
jgi:hypothetical protein